jgi:intracellular septation protein
MAARKQINPFLKLALEIGPLVVFFLANGRAGIFVATGLFMAAVLVSLVASYALTRHLPIMPIVTGVVVLIFGGLTLLLQDEHFIKLKPTIVNLLFAAALFAGMLMNKPLLKIVLDAVFDLTDEGWRKLTLRWALFFLFLAALNEVVWRGFSTDTWVSFKVFGVMPLTFVFALAQVPLLQRYAVEPADAEPTDASPPAES